MIIISDIEKSGDYKIADLSLHEIGRKEIEIAKAEMPGLMNCRRKYIQTKPLEGKKISGCLHMTIKTAVLIETLSDQGADVRWCSDNIYSTLDHAAAALVKSGKSNVFAWKNLSYNDYWQCTLNACSWPDGSGPDSIIDAFGDLTLLISEGAKAELKYELSGELPTETRQGLFEDDKALFTFLKDIIPSNSKRFRRIGENILPNSDDKKQDALIILTDWIGFL